MFRVYWVLLAFFLFGFSTPKRGITVFLAGDSTMSFKPKTEHPERGWGMLLPAFFDDQVTIANHAMNGRSTKTFLSEGRWEAMLDKVGRRDYVVIQFGHNDSSKEKAERYTTPKQYEANLVRFVNETRAKNAMPILCTPVMRRRFDKDGKFYDTHGVYPDIVRQVADSLHVPLVDMHRMSEQVIVAHGEEGSKRLFLHIQPGEYEVLPDGLEDNTHFSEYGARIMAGLFVQDIKELKIKQLTKHLREK